MGEEGAAGGAVAGVSVGPEHGLGFDPYGAQVPLKFGGSCTATATASRHTNAPPHPRVQPRHPVQASKKTQP